MNFLENTFWTKRITVLVSFLIVSLILWNTYIFFQKVKQEERTKMEILSIAQKDFVRSDLDANIELVDKIISTNHNIPLILADRNGVILSYQNLDSVKALDSAYLEKQLEIMKEQNAPVEINYEGKNLSYIYYKDSDLLNKLRYYPVALILILILFISVIYFFYSANKSSETNKLWTGMAKETAHQIGTPLSSLLGWISILKTGEFSGKYVDEIEKDVYRLNTIADRFSKIGSIPELKEQNLVLATKQAFDYLESRSSKQINFTFSTTSDEVYAPINVELFGWVIENLIRNAIDAMQGKGEVSLTIEIVNANIKIKISDTGKGMPKKMFKQVFKPGFTTKKRGWGLGLSLSKRIIKEYHKGKIFVKKSEIGKGTTLQIVLKSALK